MDLGLVSYCLQFRRKTAAQMNSTSIFNFAGKGIEEMGSNNTISIYKEGHQIRAHTMNHLKNMTSRPESELNYEIGQSKRCLEDHGIHIPNNPRVRISKAII